MIQLPPEKYVNLQETLAKVTFNCYFALSVIKHHLNGKVYVDNEDMPANAYILHPYGMSLLIGDGKNAEFKKWFVEYMLNLKKERIKNEWMQVFSNNWQDIIQKELHEHLLSADRNVGLNYSDYIEVNTRVNFKFNDALYKEKVQNYSSEESIIKKLDKETTGSIKGSVIPLNFWNNEDEFLNRGIGFSVFKNGEQVSTAYSAFVHDKYLEIGIETVQKYRGFGHAKSACSALIDYCITNNFEPIWSCRLENAGSYRLALSLGFEPVLQLPYYRLCKCM
ncbi:MAG: GNAT family N-acetyltransferase [Fibrobacter sp.]|nr:GNAT family N-acetyltransferase [Fibrobacter sp.]